MFNFNVCGYPINIVNRFWRYVSFSYYNDGVINCDGCMIWMKSIGFDGYGRFWTGIKQIRAHRFSYNLLYGEIENNLQICHICDCPKCVNPFHLWSGTIQDNRNDCLVKNRQSKGDFNGNSKLTYKIVRDIILKVNDGQYTSYSEIAKEYSVQYQTISNIFNGKNWSYIFDDLNFDRQKLLNKLNNRRINIRKQILFDEDISIILKLISEGYSNYKIAQIFEVNPTTIRNIKIKYYREDIV